MNASKAIDLRSDNDLKKKIDRETANQARQRIQTLIKELSRYFVGKERKRLDDKKNMRDELIFLMAIAVVAREPMLILGPPGTAKSDMVIRFSEACGVKNYFEHMLTMFTEPSEIIGPVDIEALKKGVYRRILDGRIADSAFTFLDEIFKGNSAILNTLLTLMNEHKIYDGVDVKYLPDEILLGFFAASNEIPDNAEILPLKDRFPIKVKLNQVRDDEFFDLIEVGVQNELDRNRDHKPWKNCCGINDFIIVRRYFFELMSEVGAEDSRRFRFQPETEQLFKNIVMTLRKEYKINISDRQVVKLYRLIATRAYLDRGAYPCHVDKRDLVMLRYTAERLEDFAVVNKFVTEKIGG